MPRTALSSPYGIQLSPTAYLILATLLVAAGLYIIINPKAFLRWGRGRASNKEPDKPALMAVRFVGLSAIAMAVVGWLSMNQG